MATLNQTQLNALNSLKGHSASFGSSGNTITSVQVANIGATASGTGIYNGQCVTFVKNARPELSFTWTNPDYIFTHSANGSFAGFHVDSIPVVGSAFITPATSTNYAGHTGIVTAVSEQRTTDINGKPSYNYLITYREANYDGTASNPTGHLRYDSKTISFPADAGWKFIWGTNTDYTTDKSVIMGEINQLFSSGLLAHSYSAGSQADIDGINKLVNRFFLTNTADKHTNLTNLVELYYMENGSAVNVNTLAGGEWTNDVLSGAKVGTSNGDKITGDTNNNVIMSGAGNDIIDAGNGNDVVRAGIGDDTINGGYGNDTIDGGAGSDTVSYLNMGAVTVDLNKTTAQDTKGAGADTLTNIENISGSLFADTLTGNSLNNVLNGRDGNDTLIGGNGQDTLIGGLGKDTINLTETIAATDTVSIAAGDSLVTSYDVVSGFKLGAGTTSTIGIDKLDLASITIAANALKVDGANVGTGINAIMSHHIDKGIISFDDINNYTAPVTVTATNLANVINYLQANIASSNTVGFVTNLAGVNHTFVFQDGGVNDTLVDLVGVAATSLNTTGLAAGAVWII